MITIVLVVSGASLAAADTPPEMPVFPNFAFSSVDGSHQLDLESLRGKPVLITFWASWCGPCRQELPELQELSEELDDTGFTLIAVNVDDSPAAGQRFLDRYEIDIPAYRMGPEDLATLGLRSLPTNVLLDREGRPVQIYKGYSPDVPTEIRQLVLGMDPEPSAEGGSSGA